MFTRFFGKSSFFSYALLLGLFVAVFFFQLSTFSFSSQTAFQHTLQTISFFLLLFLFFGLDWIVRIQYWNEKGVYHLYFFCLLFFIIPLKSFRVWELLSLLFFWIGFIQLLGLNKKNNFIKSIFNGALWMTLCGLFMNAYLFLFPLLWGVLLCYNSLNIRSFLISLLPFFAFLLLAQLVQVFVPTLWFNALESFEFQSNFPDIRLVKDKIMLFSLVVFFLFVWVYHYRSFAQKGGQYLSSIFSLLVVFFGSLAFVLFFNLNEGIALLLVILAFSALSGAYLENIKRKWIRELLLFLLTSLVVFYRSALLGL